MKKLFTLAAALLTSFSMYAGGPYVWNPSTAVSSGEISENIEGEVVISAYNGATIEEKEMASSTKAFGIKIGTSGNSSLDAGYIEISIVNDNNTISEVSLGASSNADAVKNYAAVYFSSKTCDKNNIISGEALVSVAKKVGNITDRQELNVPEGTKMIRIYRKISKSATGFDADLGDGSTIYVYSFSVVTEGDVTEPVKTVTLAGETEAYIGVATTITATATPSATEYKWFVDGAEQAGETAKTFVFTPAEAKTYSVVCKARNELNAANEWIESAALKLTASTICGDILVATHVNKTTATITGIIGGTADKNTQDNGKLGSNGHYFGVKLNGAKFAAGDVVTIVASNLEGGNNAAIYSDKGETLLAIVPFNEETMTATYMLLEETEWVYIYRTDASICNPTIATITVTRDCNAEPTLTVTPAQISLDVTSVVTEPSAVVSFSGKNLAAGTYNLTLPLVAGLTANPTTVTVAENGILNATITFTYTSDVNVAANSATASLTIGALTQNVTINYSAVLAKDYLLNSVNIEQLVLDNGVGYDIKAALAAANIDYANIDALDSLNDAKDYRNYGYLGLKLKKSGATIGMWVKAGSTLNVRFGFIDSNVKVSTETEALTKADYSNNELEDANVYSFKATEDTYVLFTTPSDKTVVFKQIMLNEDIKVVTLPEGGNTGSGLDNVNVELNLNAPMYNVLGVQVDSNYKGIVIQNGKKFMLQ